MQDWVAYLVRDVDLGLGGTPAAGPRAQLNGEIDPTGGRPPTAKDYVLAGSPWFDYYSDRKAL